jgi:hypothetical protein
MERGLELLETDQIYTNVPFAMWFDDSPYQNLHALIQIPENVACHTGLYELTFEASLFTSIAKIQPVVWHPNV